MRRCVAIGAMLVAGRFVTFPKIFIKQDVTGAASPARHCDDRPIRPYRRSGKIKGAIHTRYTR
jgi:hypothetical protein